MHCFVTVFYAVDLQTHNFTVVCLINWITNKSNMLKKFVGVVISADYRLTVSSTTTTTSSSITNVFREKEGENSVEFAQNNNKK